MKKSRIRNGLLAFAVLSASLFSLNPYKAEATQQTWGFDAVDAMQTFTAPQEGVYQLEVWGASGGTDVPNGGRGAYAKGKVTLTAGQKLYVFVGGQGHYYGRVSYNGGGVGPQNCDLTTGGGGATDIRTEGNYYWNELLDKRIIVAGGGGGQYSYFNTKYPGGYGGAEVGGSGYNPYSTGLPTGGSQTAPGSEKAGFGYGGSSTGMYCAGGGGGGYYGGGSSSTMSNSSGAGGSSYIGGVQEGQMIAGNQVMPNGYGGVETGHSGSGYARITFVGTADTTAPTAPSIQRNGNVITIQAGTDAESGVKETQVAVNNGAWSVYSSKLTLADGEYSIQAKTIDKAGNQSTVTSVTYTLFDNALKTATNEVVKAEQEKTQEQVDKAKDLVVALPTSPEKDALLDRLQDVQVQIDADKALENATNEVIKAEQDKTQEQVDKAKDLVDALPASPEKDDLLDRLKDVQDQIETDKALDTARNEVEKAEQDKTQEQVDKAKDLVDALPASPEKDELLDRLKDVQDQIDADKTLEIATNEVVKAEQLKTQVQVNKAKDLVNALPNSPEKNNLLNRLKVVEDQIALDLATEKVVVAEQSRQQVDIDTAKEAVNSLQDSVSKQALLDRLNAIVPDTGGTTPPPEEVIPDKELPGEIGKLTDPADKKTFSDILKAIERAEANPTNRVLVQLAWDKVKAVPDSVKNNMQNKKVYKSLYARAEKLKNDFNAGLEQEALQLAIKKATDYVVSYEKYKLTAYKTKAQDAVNALPDGETKTALQARIDAVVMKTV